MNNEFFVIPEDTFTKIASWCYDAFYRLYLFLTQFDIIGSSQTFNYTNPFDGVRNTVNFRTFGQGMLFRPIIEGIEKLFKIDLSVTPLELMLSSALLLILAYAVVKFLVPIFN